VTEPYHDNTGTSVSETFEYSLLINIHRYELLEAIPHNERGKQAIKYFGDMDFDVKYTNTLKVNVNMQFQEMPIVIIFRNSVSD